MFKRKQNETQEEFDARMDRRAEILFPTMKQEIKKQKPKNLPLGKSIYDDDVDEEIKNVKNVKSELDVLLEMPEFSEKESSKMTTRQERTEDEENEFLSEFYPSMKDLIKSKKEKNGELTGGAADMKNSEKTDENLNNKSSQNSSTLKQKNSDKIANKDEDARNRETLKILGMNEDGYVIKGNTISKKYDVINNVKYQKDDEKAQKVKDDFLNEKTKNNQAAREKYLKSPKSWKNQIGVDNADNPVVKLAGKIRYGDEAVENLHMSKINSYMNTDYAKKHKVYNNYKEAPAELQEYLKGKISKQIGADKLDTTKGVYIDKDSDSSKSLGKNLIKDEEFIKKLKEYEQPMKHNFEVDESISLKGENWHNAVGNADIKKMHINKNGDIELYVTDTYDFNNEKSGAPAVGRDRQEKGEIKPYFEIYHVIIPKEHLDIVMSKDYKKMRTKKIR